MCLGRMWVPYQPRKGSRDGEGAVILKTTVAGSGASNEATLARNAAAGALALALIVSKVNLTSAEVSGWPSCHFPPSTRWKVMVEPSAATSQLFASSGMTA